MHPSPPEGEHWRNARRASLGEGFPTKELPDRELVERCRRDLKAAQGSFRTLYERHAPTVFRFLRGMVGEEAAQDCLQETFLRVLRSLERYDSRRPFKPWVLGVAHKVALNARRDSARRPAPQPLPEAGVPNGEESGGAEQVARDEERALLQEALSELPDDEREVFLLRKREGLTFEQVAAAIGCSVRTAKYRQRNALTLLAQGLRRRGLVGGSQ